MQLAKPMIAWRWPRPEVRRREVNRADRGFVLGLRLLGWATIIVIVGLALQLLRLAYPIIADRGVAFLAGLEWDPPQQIFGALPFVYGTLVSSLLAIVFSFPISMGVALFLTELAPRRVAQGVGFLVEMLAAIPSVVYGLWGIFVLAPWLRTSVEPALQARFGRLPIFSGPAYGVGMLAAGMVLAIMITPTISAICREVFSAIPRSQREAALALGATRWEMIRTAVLGSSIPGMSGAVILGLGRALGETMAVTMVIGNANHIEASLFAPAQTMASIIANEYAEAAGGLHIAALASIGLALLAVSVLINGIARVIVWRASPARGSRA